MTALEAFLENYAKMHPHKWHSCSYVRADEFHPDVEKVVITIGFQSRSSWQDLGGIYFSKSDLMAATVDYGRQHGIIYEPAIVYEGLPQRQLHYQAGKLQQGEVWSHRAHLIAPSNILSMGATRANSNTQSPPIHAEDESTAVMGTSGTTLRDDQMKPEEPRSISPNSLFLSRLQGSH